MPQVLVTAVSINYTHNSVVQLLIETYPRLNKPLLGVVRTTIGGFFLFKLGYNSLFLLLFRYRYAYSNRNTKKLAVQDSYAVFFSLTAILSQNLITPSRTPYYGS